MVSPSNEKAERAAAWVAAWRAVQTSTARVERDRAERAMAALYRERGLEAPRFLWVERPADGVMAWHLASRGREPLRNPYTKGDTGTGSNRALYQLHDPFGLDPAWSYRALRRAEELAPAGQPGGFHFDGSYSANGEVAWQRLTRRSGPPSMPSALLIGPLARRVGADGADGLTRQARHRRPMAAAFGPRRRGSCWWMSRSARCFRRPTDSSIRGTRSSRRCGR